MPRILSKKPCSITLLDQVSGSRITLFYRMPTAAERLTYSKAMNPKPGSEEDEKLNPFAVRATFGNLLLTGIADDAFAVSGEDDKARPISSNEQSEHYDPDWRARVVELAEDLLATMALFIFEQSILRVTGAADPFVTTSKP